MKILHILNHTQRGNGHVNVAVDLACEQARQGHEVGVLAGDSDYREVLQRHGVAYFEVPFSYRRPFALASTIRACQRALRAFEPQVLHSHMAASTVIGRVLKPLHRYDLVSTVHNSFDRQSVLMGWSDAVVCVSQAVAQLMRGRGIAADKLCVVPNGIVGSARRPVPCPPPANLPAPSILTLCGLHERKGVQDLIAAFGLIAAQRPEAHLHIVGDGPMRGELERLAAASPGAGRIHFLGFLDDPRGVLRAASVFVLASHADPFPLVILEALDAGCAVVATDVDGIPEALDFGKAGCLVAPRDPAALAQAITGLLTDPHALAGARQAAAARAEVYSVTRMATEYQRIYGALAQGEALAC